MMVAAGTKPDITFNCGRTTNELGAVPNEHVMVAPNTTCFGIALLLMIVWQDHFAG